MEASGKEKSGETLRDIILSMQDEAIPEKVAAQYRTKYELASGERISWKQMIARSLLKNAAAGDATAVKEVAKIMAGTEDRSEVGKQIIEKLFVKVAEFIKMPETLAVLEEAFEEFYREEFGNK